MKLVFKIIFFLVLSGATDAQIKSAKAPMIEEYMKRAYQLGVFNGNVLVSGEGNRAIYKGSLGYADAKRKIPLTEQSIFRIGSIAKEFNAVGIMMLKEQGKLNLDQTVSEFFPDLPPWAGQVKIKHLLQYTSGLPDVNWYTIKSEQDNWKDLYALTELKFKPGSDYFYNNNNTFLQRKIIEKITGMTFADFVQQEIVRPCGMTNAVIDPKDNTPFLTQSFDQNFEVDTMVLHINGWTCVNMEDFYKWSQSLVHFKNINPASTLEILTPVAPGKQAGLGKGTMKNNQIVTHIHDGTSISSQALLVTDVSKKRTFLFLTNQKHDNLYEINEDLNNILDNKPYSQPRKSILQFYKKQLDTMDAKAFFAFYENLKVQYPDDFGFGNRNTLNEMGYYYLYDKNKPDDAVTVFEKNAALFPNAGDIIDSLAEGYLKQGDKTKALYYYRKSMELGYTENPDAKKIIDELTSNK